MNRQQALTYTSISEEERVARGVQLRNRAISTGHIVTLLVAAVALLVFIGWIFDIGELKSVLPGFISMNPVTALCFGLSAVAVAVVQHSDRHSHARIAAVALAMVVAGVGAIKFQ